MGLILGTYSFVIFIFSPFCGVLVSIWLFMISVIVKIFEPFFVYWPLFPFSDSVFYFSNNFYDKQLDHIQIRVRLNMPEPERVYFHFKRLICMKENSLLSMKNLYFASWSLYTLMVTNIQVLPTVILMSHLLRSWE